jgi:hypothetical protein
MGLQVFLLHGFKHTVVLSAYGIDRKGPCAKANAAALLTPHANLCTAAVSVSPLIRIVGMHLLRAALDWMGVKQI